MELALPIQDNDLARFRGHPVQLEAFEGPLDLLLHLLRRDRIEIWQISVSRITQQYLQYLSTLQALNIEVAGDFLVMAATLMRMKSQMLLPRPSFLAEDDEDRPMTRDELIARLIEYRRFRDVARRFRLREEAQSHRFPRGAPATLDRTYVYPLREPRLFDLMDYLREILQRREARPGHEVQLEEYRLEEQMEWVAACLLEEEGLEPMPDREAQGLRLSRLLRRPGSLLELVVTVLAVLELARQQRLRAWQREPLDEVWLLPARSAEAAGELPI